MSEASAYVVEEIQEKLEAANKRLIDYSKKSVRAISAKKDLADYEKGLGEVQKTLERTLEEYPGDGEIGKFSDRFASFYNVRHNQDIELQKETITHLISDLKSMVHWRKMETAYGRTLGFSDFRNLRGEAKKR